MRNRAIWKMINQNLSDKAGVMLLYEQAKKTSQPVGLSGNKGYPAFLYLHLKVQGFDAAGQYKKLATRFYANKVALYPGSEKFYKTGG